MWTDLPTSLWLVLSSLLWNQGHPPPPPAPLRFHLRHAHALLDTPAGAPRSVFADTAAGASFVSGVFDVPTAPLRTHRPPSGRAVADARLHSIRHAQTPLVAWSAEEVPGPDVTKHQTLLQLAKMTANAYYGDPGHKSWYPMQGWNASIPFGWEPDADGFRGHIFVSDDNSTVVLSIKGTSAPWIAGGEGPTKKKDKLNDNLLFSCCCARVGPTWSPVCGCYAGGDKCDSNCVERALVDDSLFYHIGIQLYNDVAYMYPDANIWMTGHSLGGSLAALLGATFGAPVVAFETPAERLAAQRLHLPSPPEMHHITHVFHNGDPIPMGTCTGVTSSCALGGFALETRCHQGRRILYDTVGARGWSVDARQHGIDFVLAKLLDAPWGYGNGTGAGQEGDEGWREVPAADVEADDCVDCYNWQFGDFQ